MVRQAIIAAAILAALPAGYARAQDSEAAGAMEPRALSFTSGIRRYEVPPDGFNTITYKRESGLELCMTEPVEKEVSAFTEKHRGEVVTVAIGDVEVIKVQIVTPYAGGCLTWPIHPMIAANYIAMLTGQVPRTPVPLTGTGE